MLQLLSCFRVSPAVAVCPKKWRVGRQVWQTVDRTDHQAKPAAGWDASAPARKERSRVLSIYGRLSAMRGRS